MVDLGNIRSIVQVINFNFFELILGLLSHLTLNLLHYHMECRLVSNNRADSNITNNDMCGYIHQLLKYYKFHRVSIKTGKPIFYLFSEKKKSHILLFERPKQ